MSEAELDDHYAQTLERIETLEMRNMLRREEDKLGGDHGHQRRGRGAPRRSIGRRCFCACTPAGARRTATKVKVLDYQAGDEVGVKSLYAGVRGEYAYGYLKSETACTAWCAFRLSTPITSARRLFRLGVRVACRGRYDRGYGQSVGHRVGHVPFERRRGAECQQGRDGRAPALPRKDADTGEPVEFLIENMETRSQLMNRENAMRILRSKLYQRELDKRMATQQALEASKKKIEWGSQIRSYVFDDRRVKDHRTGVQTSAVEAVMDGDLDAFIKAYLMEYGAEA